MSRDPQLKGSKRQERGINVNMIENLDEEGLKDFMLTTNTFMIETGVAGEKGNIIHFGDAAEDCFIKNNKSNHNIFTRRKKGSYVLDVEFVIKKDGETISLGKGEITVDRAAEESVCPRDWGGALPLKDSKKQMHFKTASGQDMQHYGERQVTCITETRLAPWRPEGFPRHP